MLTRLAIIAAVLAATSFATGGVRPLDPNSEEPLRDQVNRIVQSPATRPALPTTREALESELGDTIAVVEREIVRLRTLGESGNARADDLSCRLRVALDRRNGKDGDDKRAELHVVNIQALDVRADKNLTPAQRRRQFVNPGARATIEVQATGRPVVLALSSYGPIRWDVRAAEGVKVERILVGGYEDQTVLNQPAGVPLEIHTSVGRNKSPNYFYGFGANPGASSNGAERLRALTPLPIATIQSPRQYGGELIVIGPQNPEWVAQRALALARPLTLEASAAAVAAQREAVRDVRFKAVRAPSPDVRPLPPVPAAAAAAAAAVPGPRGGGVRVMVRPAFNAAAALADHTPAGPLEGTELALPARTSHVAIDPNDSTVYAAGEAGVYRVDAKSGAATRIQPDAPELPRMTSCNGVTFDTKRRRLIVSTERMLYAHDPASAAWSGLVELEGVSAASFAYSEADDCLYALLLRMGHLRLMRYTAEGDADQVIELSRPVLVNSFGPDATPQLIVVGRQLAVITAISHMEMMRARTVEGELRLPRPKCYLIEPKSGEVTFAAPVEPRPAPAENPDEHEVERAWRSLTAEEPPPPPDEAERATKTLAAGRERTISFLRGQFSSARPAPADPKQVQAWIDDLSHDDFKRRDAAMRALRKPGIGAEAALRDALAKQPSAEAVNRIETLLHDLRPEVMAARRPARDKLMIDLLVRIGSPAAIDLLGDFASGPGDEPRTHDARKALQDYARDE